MHFPTFSSCGFKASGFLQEKKGFVFLKNNSCVQLLANISPFISHLFTENERCLVNSQHTSVNVNMLLWGLGGNIVNRAVFNEQSQLAWSSLRRILAGSTWKTLLGPVPSPPPRLQVLEGPGET